MDQLLLRRAINGEKPAYDELLSSIEVSVNRYCHHYLNNDPESEDCAVEAMVKIWIHLGEYSGKGSFEGWCKRIAINTCRDFLRKRARNKAVSLNALQEQGYDPVDTSPTTEEAAMRKVEKEEISAAVRALPEDQQIVLIMNTVDGLDYAAIAQRLGISVGTVKSRLNRARKNMVKLVEHPVSNGTPAPDKKPILAPVPKRSRGRDP